MSMLSTLVVIADDGSETVPAGSACTDLYNLLKAQAVASMPAGQAFPTGADSAPILKGIAASANTFGQWMVVYLGTHAQARIPASAGGDGLQKDSTTAPTTHPAVDKFLVIV